MKTRATIRDVAREAGLSVATVSGALNGTKGFARDTIRRVWDAAAKLNYTPLAAARKLQAGGEESSRPRSSLIMHVVARNTGEPTFSGGVDSAISCLAWMAQKRNFFSIPCSYYDAEGFRCPPFLNGYADGAVIATSNIDVVRQISSKIPAVLVDAPFTPGRVSVPMVNGNWRSGISLLLKRLAELGHRNVSILQPYVNQELEEIRYLLKLFRLEAEDAGISVSGKYSFKADFSPRNNETLLKAFAEAVIPGIRQREISAVFAPHVSYLKELMPLLTSQGIRVPEDVSLCAPDVSVICEPVVSSLWVDYRRIFEAALDLLEDMIASHRGMEMREVLLPPELKENRTLGPAPPGNGVKR